jgi:diguanylate cyclase (GGDEF)-like protein/PAS domain S-box-containing protein
MSKSQRPQNVALAALFCGLALTLLAWWLAQRQARNEAQAEFANQAYVATNVVEKRIQRYIDALYGLGALASHDASLSRLEFHEYAAALQLRQRLPGVQAVELIRRVHGPDLGKFEALVRNDRSLSPEGFPTFQVKPPGVRDEYWVVDYVEPLASNEVVFGLDMRTRASVKAAEQAVETGEAVMTGRYRLAQEIGGSSGLVIYLPVFSGEHVETAEARRLAMTGLAAIVVRVDDMLGGLMADPAAAGLRVRMYDVGPTGAAAMAASGDALFYLTPGTPQSRPSDAWSEWRPVSARELPIAGRQWRLEFEGRPELAPWFHSLPLLVALAGGALSLLLYAMLRAQARARTEAVDLADKATAELRAQLSFTQQLIEAIPNPVFFKDTRGRYLGCNHAFEDYVGYSRDEVIGKTVFDLTPSETADRSQLFDAALLEQPGAQMYEAHVANAKDGTYRDVLFSKATFYDPAGAVAGLVGVIVDITQRKQLEADTRESNERLRAVIHAAPMAIVARDLKDVIRMWNPAAERMFGWKEEDVRNTRTSVVPVHLKEETRPMRERAQGGESIWIEETQRQRRDGRMIDVSVSIVPIYGADGQVSGTMTTTVDITRRKQAEQLLRESEARLRLAMDAAQMGIWYWESANDQFEYSNGVNPLFGRPVDAPHVGYAALLERMHPEDRELFGATIRHAIKHGEDFQVDYRVVWPDGTTHWMANRAQVYRDASGWAQRVVGVVMDITDRKMAEQRVAHMAHHDALTGLPNRVLLRDRIQHAIAQAHRAGTKLAVLFIDLDRFKTINDSLGHQLGDRLLQAVASRILVCVREGDTVARVGGDEFVIVIPGIETSADASTVAGKILEVLGNPFHLHGNDLHVGASIGISLYPSDGGDAETLMRNADTAMYAAKDAGRGNFKFFTQHMNVAAQQRLTLETALRRALENGEFELFYQPIFDLRDRSISGFEALVRWRQPGNEEIVEPDEFIGVAEESSLIVPLGDWVLREALTQAKAWQTPERPLTIAINVSANQLSRRTFVDRLRQLISETRIDPRLIELEVTESVIIEGASEARDALDQIAALGVDLAIDDFGTGYSGLAYLKRLPIDTVKIDQSFVRDLTIDPDDAAIVTAIVAMARSLAVDVVAEGVETEEQLEELRRLGCQRAQGYLLARPMAASAISRLLGREPVGAAAD